MSTLDRALGAGLAVFFAVGLAGHLLPATRPLMTGLTPIALLLTAGVVAVPLAVERNARVARWALFAVALGFVLEVLGVATGLVFGRYSYGFVLGPRLLGVPLIIGVNWAVVVLGAVSFAQRKVKLPLAAAALAGAITAGFDMILEPVAVRAGYWTWADGFIPVQNYIAWFLIAAFLAFLFSWRRLSVASWIPSIALLIQVCFFTLLRVTASA